MADEAKLHNPIYLTSEMLVVGHMVGCCHAEKLGPFCWPMPAAGIAVFSAPHWFAEHTSRMEWFRWDSESCSGSDRQQTTKQWVTRTLCLGASLALGNALELLCSVTTELVIVGCGIKFTFLLHVTIKLRNGLLVVRSVREDKITKQRFSWFVVSSWGTYLSSFSTSPIYSNAEQLQNGQRWVLQQLLMYL